MNKKPYVSASSYFNKSSWKDFSTFFHFKLEIKLSIIAYAPWIKQEHEDKVRIQV